MQRTCSTGMAIIMGEWKSSGDTTLTVTGRLPGLPLTGAGTGDGVDDPAGGEDGPRRSGEPRPGDHHPSSGDGGGRGGRPPPGRGQGPPGQAAGGDGADANGRAGRPGSDLPEMRDGAADQRPPSAPAADPLRRDRDRG